MERNIQNWLKVITEAQREEVIENYDGVYDSHLKAQSVVGPSAVNLLSDEAVAAEIKRHIHNRRRSTSSMRLLLPTDENITSDTGDDGGDTEDK